MTGHRATAVDSAAATRAVEPLERTTRGGDVLRRPARIEAEIAGALALAPDEVLRRAAGSENDMSSECMVHLIRHDLRRGSRRLAEALTPRLLERCEASLKGSVRGFSPAAAAEVREEVLGRLAVALAGDDDRADFFEVRFALAFKRLKIDVCRLERRREQGRIALDDAAVERGREAPDPAPALERLAPPSPARQEERLLIRQALAALTTDERRVLVLHKLAGISLASKAPGSASLVRLLGSSERTLRNRLRSAEAKLRAFHGRAG